MVAEIERERVIAFLKIRPSVFCRIINPNASVLAELLSEAGVDQIVRVVTNLHVVVFAE